MNGSSTDDISPLVLLLNEGLLSPRPWDAFMAALTRRIDAFAVSLMLRCPSSDDPGIMHNYGIGIPDVQAHYTRHYFAYDPFVNLPEGDVYTLHEFVRHSERTHAAVYMKFLEEIDMVYILGVDLRMPGLFDARFRITRKKCQGDFGAADKRLCEQLVPHLRIAIRLAFELDRVRTDRAVYSETMDQLMMAAIVLDETGKISHMSRLAELIVAQRDGISVWNRELILASDRNHAQLKQAITRALRMRNTDEPTLPEILQVRRPSGRPDFGMIVRPVRPGPAAHKGLMTSSVAIFLNVDNQRKSLSAEAIQKVFGLTPAEAELTRRLVSGQTLAEASEQLAISENTARTHLRAIFAKTGFARQSQLVSGVLGSIATLGH